jgi:predicted Zn-dependent protease
MQGRRKDALIHAKRAMEQAPAGSRAWQRALDVVDSLKQS